MTKILLIASTNQGKVAEIQTLLQDLPYQINSLQDLPEPLAEVEETGATFEENARLKARTIGQQTKRLTLADDSGLIVDALNGRPGVHSARYGSDAQTRNLKLLGELEAVPDPQRTARFVCSVSLFDPATQKFFTTEGVVEGKITLEPKGVNGFGYDPIFYAFELEKTFAQASEAEKNRISHRARALTQIRDHL